MRATNRVELTFEVPFTHPSWVIEDDVTMPEPATQDECTRVLVSVLRCEAEREGHDWQVHRNRALRWDEKNPRVGVDPDGYRFHDIAGVPARFAFGHGLSYTTFAWSDVALTGTDTDVTVTLTVTNTGDRAGSDVVQVYVRPGASVLRRPDKELKGFAKVHLEPGASETVAIALDRRAFAVWDVDAHDWVVPSGAYHVLVGESSRALRPAGSIVC